MGGFAFVSFVGHQTRFVLKPAPLFFDLDHTLWDFESNSRHALRAGFEEVGLKRLGIENPEGWIEAYEAANEWCWSEFRHGRMDKETLRAERFRLAMERVGVTPSPAVAEQLGEHYIATSPHQTALMEGTHEVLEALLDRGHDMWLLTNGFDEVQHIKVEKSGLQPYFLGVYTSDSLGVKKPHSEAFQRSAQRAGVAMDAGVVMIGDSWESDVQGAQNVGWKGVHFNPSGEVRPDAWRTVRSLRELLDLPLEV
jgi:putative hydrolase of the HAD superfamily